MKDYNIHRIIYIAILLTINFTFNLYNVSAKQYNIATYDLKYEKIQNMLENLNSNSVVFVQLDNVIITPKAQMFRDNSLYKEFISNLENNARTQIKLRNIINDWYKQRELIIVENKWPNFLRKLKDKGIKVFGLARLPIYAYEAINNITTKLIELDIEFTREINDDMSFQLSEFETYYHLFYYGVLFYAELDPSNTIKTFLKDTELSYYTICLFTSEKGFYSNTISDLRKLNVDIYHIYYAGHEKIKFNFDYDIIDFQQKNLLESGSWLEDAEAEKLYKFSLDIPDDNTN